MTIDKIKKAIAESTEYSFLMTDRRLGNNIALLTLGGSHAYGTNIETSDVDIRGVAAWTPREVLLGKGFDVIHKDDTDTVIYALDKFINMLADLNPSVVEVLGCKPEHYLQVSPIGQLIIDNKDLFLSKRCINSFGGFAFQQAKDLRNCIGRSQDQTAHEKCLMDALKRATDNFQGKFYNRNNTDVITYTLGESKREGTDAEVYLTIGLKDVPVRDFLSMSNELQGVVHSYDKNGKRAKYAIEKNRLGKMMMHCIRSYHMAFDLLEDGKIVTYREKDHDELMAIRNGCYLDEDGLPKKEFFELVNELDAKLQHYRFASHLPDRPNDKAIEELLITAHKMILDETLGATENE